MRKLICSSLVVMSLLGCPGPSTEGTDGGVLTDGGGAGTGPCGLASNPEPNDTRDTASVVAINADVTYCLGKGDVDFVAFTTPADVSGGTVQLQFTQVGTPVALDVEVTAASDNGPVTSTYNTAGGASLTIWFSAQPGTTFKAKIQNFAGAASDSAKYNLNVVYAAVPDTFEPNNTRDAAKPITLGTAINAYFTGGFSTGTDPGSAYDDWYSFTAAAGAPIRAQLTNVATDWAPYVEIFAPDNSKFASKYTTTEGQSLDLTSDDPVTAPGAYTLRVYSFAGYPNAEGKGGLADHMTRPYSLTVTQP